MGARLDLDDVAAPHPVALAELAALRRLAEIARRHYGRFADLDAALDAVEESL